MRIRTLLVAAIALAALAAPASAASASVSTLPTGSAENHGRGCAIDPFGNNPDCVYCAVWYHNEVTVVYYCYFKSSGTNTCVSTKLGVSCTPHTG